MSLEMAADFADAVRLVATDPEVRSVVLTGEGEAFSAGGDLSELAQQTSWSAERIREHMGAFYRSFLSVIDLPVPTIAAVGGAAIGAGLALALACDIRYAAAGARVGTTYVNIGLFPGMGATHLLPYHVGHGEGARMLLTGAVMAAEEAPAGLFTEVVPRADVLPRALATAREIAGKSPSAVRMMKDVLRRRMKQGLEAALDAEALAQSVSFRSEEMKRALGVAKA